MERTCKKCGETKPIEEFVKDKSCLFGRGHTCGKCHYQRHKSQKQTYNLKNKEKIKLYKAEHYLKNRKKIMIASKDRYQRKKEHILQYSKEYRCKNKDKIKIKDKKYHQNNILRIKAQRSEYRQRNKEVILEQKKKAYIISHRSIDSGYVLNILRKRTGLSSVILRRQYPELIELCRKNILEQRTIKSLQRSLKSLQNETPTNS